MDGRIRRKLWYDGFTTDEPAGKEFNMNNRTAGDNRITALYERLSRDDEKSNRRKAKLFFSASIGDAVFALLDSPDKFVVDGNTLFLTLAAASHTWRFVNRNPVNQLVKHEAVEFFKAGVFSESQFVLLLLIKCVYKYTFSRTLYILKMC